MAPILSVIMPVFNGEEYLDLAIRSVLDQSFSDFEFIIVNDGSKDGSLSILREYRALDDRIILINKTNHGIVDALNDGIASAKGKYIARMDCDDISFPNRFEEQVAILIRDRKIDLVYSDTKLIDKNGAFVCDSWRPDLKKTLKNLEVHTFIPHPTVMFRKQTVMALGGYTKKLPNAEDLDLWLRMRDSGCGFFYLEKNLLHYRLNPNSVRASSQDDYWYKVASRALVSGYKRKVFSYFKYLKFKNCLVLLAKMFLPQKFFYRKLT